MNAYAYWKSALAGEKPKMYVDDPQLGFYRRAIYTKEPNKAAKRTGWTPVALFRSDNPNKDLIAVIGVKTDAHMIANRDALNNLWSYIAANPISEETYRAVAERGESWWDSHETVASIPVANSSAVMEPSEENRIAPHVLLEIRLEDASEHMPQFTLAPIDSDETSSKARSLQQVFLDIRSEAEKGYEAANRPLLNEQKRLRSIWFPIRDKADEESNTLRKAMGGWEDEKRKAAKVAAERAEAGQDNAASNVPPPATQIRGGAGKAASVTIQQFVTAIDVDKVFEQFKKTPQLRELLTDLAQKAIRSGIDVPGATYEERSVIR